MPDDKICMEMGMEIKMEMEMKMEMGMEMGMERKKVQIYRKWWMMMWMKVQIYKECCGKDDDMEKGTNLQGMASRKIFY